MKKVYFIPILLLILSGCSAKDNLMSAFKARENPTITEVSVGKYEAPNGVEYSLFQYGSGFYVKNGSGTILEFKTEVSGTGVGTSTGANVGSGKVDINKTTFKDIVSMKKALDSKNPLIVDKYTTPNGKVFQITNYKGVFGIIYPDGKKGTGTFATKEGLMKFLDVNNGVCNIINNGVFTSGVDDKKYEVNISYTVLSDCGGKTLKYGWSKKYGEGSFDLKLSDGKLINLMTYPEKTDKIYNVGIELPENSRKIENNNGAKIMISNFGAYETDKEMKQAYEYLKTVSLSQTGEFKETYEEYKNKVLSDSKINKSVGVVINNDDIDIRENLSETEYNELIQILKTIKITPLKKVIDWKNIKTVVLGDSQMKSLIFTDNDGLKKTVYVNPKGWGRTFGKNVEIWSEMNSYNEKTNTIEITPMIAEHFNDIYTLNLNTGILTIKN